MAALPLIGQSRFVRAQSADALTLRVDFAPWGVHAALHLAQAKGWLKEDGLTVDIQDGTGTLSTIQSGLRPGRSMLALCNWARWRLRARAG